MSIIYIYIERERELVYKNISYVVVADQSTLFKDSYSDSDSDSNSNSKVPSKIDNENKCNRFH